MLLNQGWPVRGDSHVGKCLKGSGANKRGPVPCDFGGRMEPYSVVMSRE